MESTPLQGPSAAAETAAPAAYQEPESAPADASPAIPPDVAPEATRLAGEQQPVVEAALGTAAMEGEISGEVDVVALYKRYAKPLIWTVQQLGNPRGYAEDIVQETFVRAWQHAQRYPNRPLAAQWLYVTARNLVIDGSRTFRIRVFTESEPFDELLSSAMTAGSEDVVIESILLQHYLDRINPLFGEVLTLFYLQDLSQQDIADRLGVPVGTVKGRVHSGIQAIRRLIRDEDANQDG